jgi:hypothetical protein
MLVIRAEQMAALGDVTLHPWLVKFLSSSYPDRTDAMGPAALAEFVESGIRAARARAIQDRAAIRKYVHAMFLLGPGFESDPNLVWAQKILKNSNFRTDLTRLRVLEDEALRHVKEKEIADGRG